MPHLLIAEMWPPKAVTAMRRRRELVGRVWGVLPPGKFWKFEAISVYFKPFSEHTFRYFITLTPTPNPLQKTPRIWTKRVKKGGLLLYSITIKIFRPYSITTKISGPYSITTKIVVSYSYQKNLGPNSWTTRKFWKSMIEIKIEVIRTKLNMYGIIIILYDCSFYFKTFEWFSSLNYHYH